MFNYIRGTLAEAGADYIVIDNMGIGYFLSVPRPAARSLTVLGEEITLYTHLLVREDDMSLYGFLTSADQKLFRLLLSISGIGPKAALAILSVFSPKEFYQAVRQENVQSLTRVQGIGPKSAKRILTELKDKITALDRDYPLSALKADSIGPAAGAVQDAAAALLALGYSATEAQTAIEAVQGRENMSADVLLRKALAHISTM